MRKTVAICVWPIAGVLLIAVPCFLFAAETSQKKEIIPPETIIMQSLEGEFGDVVFDHKMHAKEAKRCGSCHHHIGAEETRQCGECHAIEPSMFSATLVESFLPCKSCHRAFNPGAPRMKSLMVAYHAQCFSCHSEIGKIGKDPKGCEELCHEKRTKAKK